MHPRAAANLAQFLSGLDIAPAPPHREQSGRAAPDRERDLAAAASRVWHEPVERVDVSKDRVAEAERLQARGPCNRCRIRARAKGRTICPECRAAGRVKRRRRAGTAGRAA